MLYFNLRQYKHMIYYCYKKYFLTKIFIATILFFKKHKCKTIIILNIIVNSLILYIKNVYVFK